MPAAGACVPDTRPRMCAGKALASDSGPGDKKKRWAAVRGVFGALGKFKKKDARKSEGAADAASETSGQGEGDHARAVSPVPTSPGTDVRSAAGAVDAMPTGVQAPSEAEPAVENSAMPHAVPDGSPLRTLPVEPTPRDAALSLPEPISEEATPRNQDSREPPRSPPMLQLEKNGEDAARPESAACSGTVSYGPVALPIRESESALLPRAVSPSKQATRDRASPQAGLFAGASMLWPLKGFGSELRPRGRFSAERYANLGTDPAMRTESVIIRLATEAEKRERTRRRRLAAGLIMAEQLRSEMEANVCLELDNLERQRSRIQAHEEEEEERWRRIEEHHLHASNPLQLRSQREESLTGVIVAEEHERSWRLSQNAIQAMSKRSRYADDIRRALNSEFSKIVWPAVESQAPAGEEEARIPAARSRHCPEAVLFFLQMQRGLNGRGDVSTRPSRTPNRMLLALEAMQTTRQPPMLPPGNAEAKPSTTPVLPSEISSRQMRQARLVEDKPKEEGPVPSKGEGAVEASANAHLGWLDSLKATVVHIAEDTVELAERASEAAAKRGLPGQLLSTFCGREFRITDSCLGTSHADVGF